MGRFVDNIIAFRILRILTTPFKETDAYRLGIIDERGKELKRMRDLHTDQELEAYTLLHRLVFRIKRIIEKVPIENKKIVSYAAAISLVKEHLDHNNEPADLEARYVIRSRADLTEEIQWVQNNITANNLFTFKQFSEDLGGGATVAPANNIAFSGGIDKPEGPNIFGKKITRRKSNVQVA